MLKTGECYWLDQYETLWLAESFIDSEGTVSTTQTLIKEASELSS